MPVMDDARRVMEQAARMGVTLTDEQLATAVARMREEERPNRVDGAPATPMPIDNDLTPPTYTQAMRDRIAQLQGGGPSNPLPGQPGWDTEATLLDYKGDQTTEEDMEFAGYNRAERQRARDLGLHPQQEMGYPDTPAGREMWRSHMADRNARAAAAQRRADFEAAGVPMTSAPGPRDFTGANAAPPREFETPEESAAYYRRDRIQGSDTQEGYKPSQYDRDMLARGYIYGIDPQTGQRGYFLAAGPVPEVDGSPIPGPMSNQGMFDSMLPGNPGRFGPRPELLEAGWEIQTVTGVTGQPVRVYRPGPKVRQQTEDREQESRIGRLANRAGMLPEEARILVAENKDDGMRILRDRGLGARQDDERARRRAVTNRAMLAGGDPSQNLTNAFTMMGEPDTYGLDENQARALQYMMPGANLLAEIEARQLDAAASLASSTLQRSLGPLVTQALGQGGPQDPAAAAFDQAQQGNYQHPAVYQYARDYISQNYYTPGGFGSYFTTAERDKTVSHLMSALGLPEADARAIVDSF